MRILIYGAGAIGSIFAGKLAFAGFDVTLLARNARCKELKDKGLVLRNVFSNKIESIQIRIIDSLPDDDLYEYILVVVQYTQIDLVLPILSRNRSKNIVFVVNNPSGYQKYIDAVGAKRVLIGFPCAGGERKDGVVTYFIGTGLIKLFQSTTFGELQGKKTNRLMTLLKMFQKAAFSPSICNRMDDWQKTHIAVVVPIAKALYRFESNNYKLAKSYQTVKKVVLATRECFAVLQAMHIKITPFKLHFYYLPTVILTPVFMLVMNTKIAEFAMAKHTIVAYDEMRLLEDLFYDFIKISGIATPALNWLSDTAENDEDQKSSK